MEPENNLERIALILKSFERGTSAEVVAKEIGYKQTSSLSRFMKNEGYR